MKLIVGLGNPGPKYETTWHNLGFLTLDEFRSALSAQNFQPSKKFKAQISQSIYQNQKIILAKPTTYMNKSGQAVKILMTFYKIKPEDLWVVNDDIDLPLGSIRVSTNASAAGHNGVKSIINEIGSQNFVRFRIGIKSHKQGKMPTENYVLKKIPFLNKVIVNKAVKTASQAIQTAINDGLPVAMNQFN